MYAPDGVLMAPNHDPSHGPKETERMLRKLADDGCEDLRLETLRVESSGDMAMEVGRYSVARHQSNGTTIADRGKYMKVWRRLGTWLIVADCWNSNLAIAA